MIAVVLALVTACAGHPRPPAAATTTTPPPKSATTSARPTTPSARPTISAPSPLATTVGVAGRYQVGERYLTFLEPPHTSPPGQHLGQRRVRGRGRELPAHQLPSRRRRLRTRPGKPAQGRVLCPHPAAGPERGAE